VTRDDSGKVWQGGGREGKGGSSYSPKDIGNGNVSVESFKRFGGGQAGEGFYRVTVLHAPGEG
jgi:hypothetical protein